MSEREYDAAQLRQDTWNRLQVSANWLNEFARAGADVEAPRTAVLDGLEALRGLEAYWAYPGLGEVGTLSRLVDRRDYEELWRAVCGHVRLLAGDAYRLRAGTTEGRIRPYFDVLFVDAIDADEQALLRASLHGVRREEDEFAYDVVTVPSFEDAVIAILFNRTIQSCVLRYNFPFRSTNRHAVFERYLDLMRAEKPEVCYGLPRSLELARVLHALRPELDLFLVTDSPLDEAAGQLGRHFSRTFYRLDQPLELHLSLLKGIRARYETPFFDALRRYSRKPAGVFHALPIARAKSIHNAYWIRDMAQFYGENIFLAETSATGGGLDSLLQPHGPIKRAQDLAARAFGAQETFFVTNGTSTANKIVVQALVRPGDIVLVSQDCHKSHHYALMLAGAHPVYLDAYPLPQYSMYGAVPLSEIKSKLRALEAAGKLDRVRMLLLTNCTFDGVTYDPLRVMREVLEIKPDMIFLWDEAWFAFAGFSCTLRKRTAMWAAARLQEMERPDDVRVRVYATHSTHKTLTSLRQGSMIHVHDEDFEQKASDPFREALMTHTSTSPNYQIVASLDVGRRQVELEGFELVQRSIGLAMALRERICEHPVVSRYFSVLRPADMIPESFRPSGLEAYYDHESGWGRMDDAWEQDEFTLDPTRVTVHTGRTALDGETMRHVLIDEHDIQVNKTSRNTVLFMTNIGTSRGDIAHLVEVLAKIGEQIDDTLRVDSEVDRRLYRERVAALTESMPTLPHFSRFHERFGFGGGTSEGDIRSAFFLAYDDAACEYLPLDGSIASALDEGREVVSAGFVTPYPPGFPVLVPGQVMSREILAYLRAVDVKEIHGYKPEYGLRVFTEAALAGESENAESTAESRA